MLANGESEAGATLHHMVALADAGDIVAQRAVPISDEDTALTLYRKIVPIGASLIREFHPLIASGVAPRRPQDLTLGSYFGRRTPADGQIAGRQQGRPGRPQAPDGGDVLDGAGVVEEKGAGKTIRVSGERGERDEAKRPERRSRIGFVRKGIFGKSISHTDAADADTKSARLDQKSSLFGLSSRAHSAAKPRDKTSS